MRQILDRKSAVEGYLWDFPAPARNSGVELILPLVNQETGVQAVLTAAAEGLVRLSTPGAIAVIDGGSSDRTVEVVDAFAECSPVPVRVVGSSRPGWAAGALRGVATTSAAWVGLGDPCSFGGRGPLLLAHAVRLLADGIHVVSVRSGGRHFTAMDSGIAAMIVGDEMPGGPDFVPKPRDTAGYAGLRMAAYGTVAPERSVRGMCA
ncbi:glycosyltransferase [Dactylosporangium sp. CA-092794]|uniref:glycosyltransferase n=1 Tax=Dactylosporangium sp. CA-092794 TaxID=3239929 RepID=UPI003D8EB9DD